MDCLQAKKVRLFQNNEPLLIPLPRRCSPLVHIARLFHPGPKGIGGHFPPLFLRLSLQPSAANLQKNHCMSLAGAAFSRWKVAVGWVAFFQGPEKSLGRLTMLRSICCLKSLLLALCLMCTLQRFTKRTPSIPEGPGSSSLTWTLNEDAIKIPKCPLPLWIESVSKLLIELQLREGRGPCLPGSLLVSLHSASLTGRSVHLQCLRVT